MRCIRLFVNVVSCIVMLSCGTDKKEFQNVINDKKDSTYLANTFPIEKKEEDVVSKKRDISSYPLFALVKNVKASSFLKSSNLPRFSYHPTNLYDRSLNSAWFEGVEGDGIGEYFEINFFTPINIYSITLSNGYGKSKSLFQKNGAVKELEVLTDGYHKPKTLMLQNTLEAQQLELYFENVTTIRFTIRSVYPGTKYQDTGISEITLESQLSTDLDEGISQTEFDSLYKYYEVYQHGDYDNPKHDMIHNLSPYQFNQFLSMAFDEPYSNADMGDRLHLITEEVLRNSSLIPVFLNIATKKNKSVFYEYANRDPYVYLTEKIWGNHPSGIPFLRQIMFSRTYEKEFHFLRMGDTRVVPRYLNLVQYEGIWHEACCEMMPSEILTLKGDWYTSLKVHRFLEKYSEMGKSDDNSQDFSVFAELSKAKDSLYKRYGEYGG
ncbi:NADase-type glycan-binding domain-containing protein [Aquimarina litoralis]|uniref:NADase-type glycan-binding domain-containing protein n=1 Tax=Aquimarina litoralis TaxID=584605 RepID=UPI001C570A72|nr:hypothetical protein [Aquimarina litoralis]MBW1296132.1 hypothetical protein [Aquimarina litoralis]